MIFPMVPMFAIVAMVLSQILNFQYVYFNWEYKERDGAIGNIINLEPICNKWKYCEQMPRQ